MSELSVNDVVVRVDSQLLVSEVGDEVVMMDTENGNYLSLNVTGKAIWDCIQEAKSVNEIVDLLMDQFEIDKETCTSGVLAILQEMNEHQVIKVINS